MYEPDEQTNKWYKLAKEKFFTDLVKYDTGFIAQINGNAKITAHKTDLLRLYVLKKYGGMYFDMDVYILRSLDELRNYPAVMGMEGPDAIYGLCNAVILSEPNGDFVNRYFNSKNELRPDEYNYFAVQHPRNLARSLNFDEKIIKVMPHTVFFWPLWDENGIAEIFLRNGYDYSKNFLMHLWEKNSYPYLSKLTPEMLEQTPSTVFLRMSKQIYQDD